MDRRSFLSTAGAAALAGPLTSLPFAPAFAAGCRRRRAMPRSTRCSSASSRSRCGPSPTFATVLGLDKGELAPLRSKLDTRPDRAGPARGSGADRQVHRLARSGARGRPLANPPRSTAKSSCGTSRPATSGPSASTSRIRKAPTRSASRTGPTSRFRISCTARTRSRLRATPRPICRGSSNSRRSSTMRRPRRGARRPRPSRARLGPRSCAEADAGAACSSARAEHDGGLGRPIAPPPRTSPATGAGAPRRSSPKRSIRRSTGRSPKSPRCGRPPGPATASGACPNGDEIYAAALAEATTTTYTRRRNPPDRPAAGRRDQRRARQDPALGGPDQRDGRRAADRVQCPARPALPEHRPRPRAADRRPQ